MECEVSVIVPIYNTEVYLKKCLDSILNQTFKNFELILIDDGSSDNCAIICDKYKSFDNRIQVIHKKNGGQAEARNLGIEIAKGNFLIFVDSDDFIEYDFIEYLLKLMYKYGSDMVVTGEINENENGKIYNKNTKFPLKEGILTNEETLKNMLIQNCIDVGPCGKLYKKEIFNEIKFPIGEIYEDFKIIHKIVDNCRIIVYGSKQGYHYVQRKNSTMYSEISKNKLILLDSSEKLIEYVSIKYPSIIDCANKRYVYCNFHLLGRTYKRLDFIDDAKKMRINILKHKSEILNSPYTSFKEKAATVILGFGLPFYYFFWNIFTLLKGKE